LHPNARSGAVISANARKSTAAVDFVIALLPVRALLVAHGQFLRNCTTTGVGCQNAVLSRHESWDVFLAYDNSPVGLFCV